MIRCFRCDRSADHATAWVVGNRIDLAAVADDARLVLPGAWIEVVVPLLGADRLLRALPPIIACPLAACRVALTERVRGWFVEAAMLAGDKAP